MFFYDYEIKSFHFFFFHIKKEKKDIPGYKDSIYTITNELANRDSFTDDTILERSREMACKLCKFLDNKFELKKNDNKSEKIA